MPLHCLDGAVKLLRSCPIDVRERFLHSIIHIFVHMVVHVRPQWYAHPNVDNLGQASILRSALLSRFDLQVCAN